MELKRKFQMGGEMPEPGMEQAPMDPGMEGGEGGGIEEQIIMMAEQIITEVGPEGAAMLAEAIMGMLQGGGEQAPTPEAPQYARRGGKLVRL